MSRSVWVRWLATLPALFVLSSTPTPASDSIRRPLPLPAAAWAAREAPPGVVTEPRVYACARLGPRGQVRLFNPDLEIVSFTARGMAADGAVVGSRSDSLLPGQQVAFTSLEQGGRQGVWLEITSSGPLSGSCTLVDEHGRPAVLALHPAAKGTGLVVPRLTGGPWADGRSGRWELTVVNAGADTTLRIVPRGLGGEVAASHVTGLRAGSISLAEGAVHTVKLDDLVGQDDRGIAWFEVNSSGRIAGALRLVGTGQEPAALPIPEAGAGGQEFALLFDRGGWSSKRFMLVNPAPEPAAVHVRVAGENGAPIADRTFALRGRGALQGRIDRFGMQVRGEAAIPLPVASAGIELSAAQAPLVRSVRLSATSPVLVARLNRGDRGALEAFLPSSPSERLTFAVPASGGEQRLLLHAAGAGDAVVRIHDPSGRESFRETLRFEGPDTRALSLRVPSATPPTPGVVSVVGNPGGAALAGIVERPDRARGVAVETPASAPPSQALPSGEALNRPPDPAAIPIPPEWEEWVRDRHHAIASLDSDNLEDLQFLKDRIGHRRIVQLGESSHGTAEFSSIKVRLIKFLHQQMGFDVIAFESGFFECEWTQAMDPDEFDEWWHLYSSVFRVWHSHEVLELFAYIRETKRTPRPLQVTGFDPQRSAPLGGSNQADYLRDSFKSFAPDLAEELYLADDEYFWNQWVPGYVEANKDRLTELYARALARVDGSVPLFADPAPGDPATRMRIAHVLRNNLRRLELDYAWQVLHRPDRFTRLRDRAMADNLEFLADALYPGKRIVVWAHDFHVRYDEPRVQNGFPHANMGWHLAQRRRHELYTVGISMYRGQAAYNNRQIYDVRRPLTWRSLEAVGHATQRNFALVDLLSGPSEPGTTWMDDWLYFWSWGIRGPYPKVPRDNYDALLFVDESHPPTYLY